MSMNIGQAIEAMKSGSMVRRRGWNGKAMHIYIEDAFAFLVRHPRNAPAERTYERCIVMFTAQGTHQPGWLASQADLLAEDWELVQP